MDSLQRHAVYYINGGDMFVLVCPRPQHPAQRVRTDARCFTQVENQHFCVHRYFFERESQFFREHLAPTSDKPAKGDSESSALVFENLKVDDFERFLWVFYNPSVIHNIHSRLAHNIYDFQDILGIQRNDQGMDVYPRLGKSLGFRPNDGTRGS